ncbi:SH3 domain-containing protein, partial [Clostridium sp. D2Q-11]
KGSDAIYEVKDVISYTILESTVDSISLTTDKEVVTEGFPLTLSTQVITTGSPNLEYKFWVYKNGGWSILKNYSESSSFIWKPSKKGEYRLVVQARRKGSQVVAEVSDIISYKVIGRISYIDMNYSRTYEEALVKQLNINPQTDIYDGSWGTAMLKDVDRYLNPENFLQFSNDQYNYNDVVKTGQIKVIPKDLHVRKEADINSEIVDKIQRGETYRVVDKYGEWFKIQTSVTSGWVHSGYVYELYKSREPALSDIKITTSVLNVRENPTTSSDIVDQVLEGQVYTALDQSNGWYKIKTSKTYGWVHGGYVTKVYSVTKGSVKNLSALEITTDVLNVRSQPSTSGTQLTQVKNGEIFIIQGESNGWYKINSSGIVGWVHGGYTKMTNQAPQEMYQFLLLSGNSGLSSYELNNILEGRGILNGEGQAFVDASIKHNINEIYLISHAFLETGYGTSSLAKGILVDTVDGKSVTPRVVYNMYGIGAYDSNPIGGGSEYAYKAGWFTPSQAIIGGAKFISERYVNNPTYKQDTLYKMKWNPNNPTSHQYATDIGWAYKQTSSIKRLYDLCTDYALKFEIPKYLQN